MISVGRQSEQDPLPGNPPLFEVGQLVRHRRYSYRGVIVAVDGHCNAEPAWYMSNQTQPDRDQPWYHVLVHGSGSCTYAAQVSLKPDTSRRPVVHALLELFFDGFDDGRHVRNDRPWPP